MKIKLFGIAREIVGSAELKLPDEVEVKNVQEFKEWLFENYPKFASLKSLAVAVNQEYADDHSPLDQNAEIALIPPVSGG
ncbi:MAG: molybdopterin converting factor subunit 1 [Lunatimonas sp.]|uniref:molybdopterin converting factor subunit 1 n=1 Tax=Lunatimonas sp. TaxID=2060141 RepID=UPI00263A87A7|nr:molybdopterin converting factor subunit 1 [Lunatimonas sp.]MCC5938837.1 molybdopterin converting factor subunit 1 [Lunatimonas sp.]